MLNGSGNGESGRSVSSGAASGTQDRVLESSEAGVTSATRDDVHNMHERAPHAQNIHAEAAAAEAPAQQAPPGQPEVPATAPINTIVQPSTVGVGEMQGVSHRMSGTRMLFI